MSRLGRIHHSANHRDDWVPAVGVQVGAGSLGMSLRLCSCEAEGKNPLDTRANSLEAMQFHKSQRRGEFTAGRDRQVSGRRRHRCRWHLRPTW